MSVLVRRAAAGAFDREADWVARSTAPGVFHRNDFTYRNAAETLLITSDAQLRASSWGGQPTGGTFSSMVYDTANKLTGGGSCRLNMPAASFGINTGFGVGWDGIAATTKNLSKNQFYLTWAFYADSVYRDTFYGVYDDVFGGKIAIIYAPNRSFEDGEVVIRRLPAPGGFMAGYRIPASSHVTTEFGLNVAALSDMFWYNFINRGGSQATLNAAQLKYGLNYNNRNDNPANDPDYQHSPRFGANAWYTFEAYVDQINDIVKVWGAPYGSAPELLFGAMNAGLPTVGATDSQGDQIFTGVQFTNYPNSPSDWNLTDTFVAYDQIAASTNQIPFPGGFSLPSPGTQTPAGYPPAGTSENG